MDITAAKPTS